METTERTERETLHGSVPEESGPGWVARTVAGVVRDRASALALLRVALAHARGLIAHCTVPDQDFEQVAENLDWDDGAKLHVAVRAAERIRVRIGGLRLDDGPRGVGFLMTVPVRTTVVLYLVAGVYRAAERRIHELAAQGAGGGDSEAEQTTTSHSVAQSAGADAA